MSIRTELMKKREEAGYLLADEQKKEKERIQQEEVTKLMKYMCTIFKRMNEEHPEGDILSIRINVCRERVVSIFYYWSYEEPLPSGCFMQREEMEEGELVQWDKKILDIALDTCKKEEYEMQSSIWNIGGYYDQYTFTLKLN